MIYPGKNLFITRNGVVLYGAKSCSVNVECDAIETSGPNSGQWRDFIAGRKEWDLTINELVGSPAGYNAKIVAFSSSHDGLTPVNDAGISYIQGPNGIKTNINYNNPNVLIAAYNAQGTLLSYDNFNTYGTEADCDDLASEITGLINNSNVKFIALCSYDAIGLNSTLVDAIADLGVDTTDWLPSGDYERYRGSLAVIAAVNSSTDGAVAQLSHTSGAPTHVELYCRVNASSPGAVEQTPLRDTLLSVGETYDIAVQVDGFPLDRLQGRALCQKATVTGSLGNLCQGSFKFKGTGALT